MRKHNRREFIEPLNDHDWSELIKGMSKRRNGVEMATVFKVCTLLLLRSSDALKLKTNQIYNHNGTVKDYIQTNDIKTSKGNTLELFICRNILLSYRQWRLNNNIQSPYLFPSVTDRSKPLNRVYYYQFVKTTADYYGLKGVGTHSARKTGAKDIYKRTGNIALVMSLLNQSSERITERYLGIKGKPEINALKYLESKFDK